MNAKRSVARAQSAMEYLTTYGWAILIIAVVLVTLFNLGIFSTSNFAPKASSGSCQVYRPGGPGSISGIALVGVCSGELPEFVASFSLQPSWVHSSMLPLPDGTHSATVTAWVNPQTLQGDGNYAGIVRIDGGSCTGTGLLLSLQGSTGRPSMAAWCDDFVPSSSPTLNYNSWNFVAVTVSGTAVVIYVNGASISSTLASAMSLKSGYQSANIAIGSTDSPGRMFNGMISNVQIYNTSLSANEIQAIYLEGIGGAPLVLQNLAGWWPLNGNANDYSGDNFTGTLSGVTFTSSWTSGYTAP